MLVLGETLVLTEILLTGRGDDEGTASWLLGHTVIVRLPVETLAVLHPTVARGKGERVEVRGD